MSNGSYYSGRPMNYTPPEPAAPVMGHEPTDNGGEQNLASAQPAPETNGYFVSRLIEQNQLAPPAPPPPAPRPIEEPQHPVSKADSYYAGRPMNYTPPEPAAPPVGQEPQVNGVEQNPMSAQAPGTNGYIAGHPIQQNQPAPPAPAPPPWAPRTIEEAQLTGGKQDPLSKPATQSYYIGGPMAKPPRPALQPSSPPVKMNATPPLPPSTPAKTNTTPPSLLPAKTKEPSFLAKCCYCCPCLSGGGSS